MDKGNKHAHYPVIPNAHDSVVSICAQQMETRYGERPPEEINRRVTKELDAIADKSSASMYLIAQRLLERSAQMGQLMAIRDKAGSSFVAFLLGITGINPLPAHYRCDACRHVEFVPEAASGYDLPDKRCPDCNSMMYGDGHDIPFETFGGLTGERISAFYWWCASAFHMNVTQVLKELLPDSEIVRAGCFGLDPIHYKWMIIPKDQINDVPISYDDKSGQPVALFALEEYFRSMKSYLMLTMEPLELLDCLSLLESETGVSTRQIKLNDPKTLDALCTGELHEIQELLFENRDCFLEIRRKCNPECFSDLVKVYCLAYGTGVWDSASLLLSRGEASLGDMIASRDDMFHLLISKGVRRESAYQVMEMVKFGKKDLPDWFIDADYLPDWVVPLCREIEYLFPKAHAVSVIQIAAQLMWYKLNYPQAYNRAAAKTRPVK